jgi:molybdopterin-biosynthesis enzyme MoeA-like protein
MNAARLRMARIPEGAALIENPVSGAPGFSLGNVHVMAGVPAIFEAMTPPDAVLSLATGRATRPARVLGGGASFALGERTG